MVALTKRNASQAAEAFRYFVLEKGGEILTNMFAATDLFTETNIYWKLACFNYNIGEN